MLAHDLDGLLQNTDGLEEEVLLLCVELSELLLADGGVLDLSGWQHPLPEFQACSWPATIASSLAALSCSYAFTLSASSFSVSAKSCSKLAFALSHQALRRRQELHGKF